VLPTINPITGPDMNTQLSHAFSNRPCISEISRFSLPQPGTDSSLRHDITQPNKPLCKWLSSILISITAEFDHEEDCSI